MGPFTRMRFPDVTLSQSISYGQPKRCAWATLALSQVWLDYLEPGECNHTFIVVIVTG
jgi:hypothetical protein